MRLLNQSKIATLIGLSLLSSVAFSSSSASAQSAGDPAEVLAKVGDVTITRGELVLAAEQMGQQFARVPAEQKEAAILNTLVDFEVLAQKAKATGLDQSPEYQAMLKMLQRRTLHDAYFRKTEVEKLDPAAVQKAYEEQTAPLKDQQEVRARHILLKTKEEAMDVIELLNRGAGFAETAKEKSTGPSGPQGGDLGFFGTGRMVPAFEAAAFALEAGDYTTEPVPTQFGFHVIKVEEKRAVPVPPLEQLEGQIRQQLLQQRYVNVLKAERDAANVEILLGN